MLSALFGNSGKKEDEKKTEVQPVRLLVIQADDYDWHAIMAPCQLADGRAVVVEQVGWNEITVCGYSHSKEPLVVNICRRNPSKGQRKNGTFMPDFVLVRNEVYTPEEDFRPQLFGLMYGGLPSVNSLSSIYSFCERPLIHGELLKIHRRLGEGFPLIEQNYFANHKGFMYCLGFPAVVKVGHAHAGAGKMKIANHRDMEDFRSVVQMTQTYCTAEPYHEGAFDLRIQKIGKHYRAYKRMSLSGTWKTNTQSSHLEEVEVTPEYKRWADEASAIFGGLEILTVDAIHAVKDDKDYILEVNGTSSGLCPENAEQDNEHIRDLVVEKLNELFAPATE